LSEIDEDIVDEAVIALEKRGKLRSGRNIVSVPTGEPLSPGTVCRYIKTLQQIYTFARRKRIVKRSFVPPTKNIEMPQVRNDHGRYFTEDEVTRLVQAARVNDPKHKQLGCIITLAAHTGLRKANLLNLKAGDIDLFGRTIRIAVTKNGEAIAGA